MILPILDNESQEYLYVQRGNLNNIGNSVIFGNSTMLSKFKNIMIGDNIEVTDKTGTIITYTVYKNDEIDSSDKSYLNRGVVNKKEITLCIMNDDASKQIVIFAEEK